MRSHPSSRVIPHQDGAGVIEAVGAGVDAGRLGQRVWVYEAQLGRPLGCAAQYTAVPSINAVGLSDAVSYEQDACLRVPALTAHSSVMADGPASGQNVMVRTEARREGNGGVSTGRSRG